MLWRFSSGFIHTLTFLVFKDMYVIKRYVYIRSFSLPGFLTRVWLFLRFLESQMNIRFKSYLLLCVFEIICGQAFKIGKYIILDGLFCFYFMTNIYFESF